MEVIRAWLMCILIVLVTVGVAVTGNSNPNANDIEKVSYLPLQGTEIIDHGSALNAQPVTIINGSDTGNYGTWLVLLGTTGGVSFWPETTSASSSSALVVGKSIYIIDLGPGSTSRLAEAFNTGTFVDSPGGKIEDGSSTFLENAKALFFTHLHQDHTADYPNLLLIGPGAGLGTATDLVMKKSIKVPFQVIGPGDRGELDVDKTNFTIRGGQVIYTDSADPSNITPTPGTRQMTNLIWQAYAQAINDITLDDGYPDFRSLITVTDIGSTGRGDITLPISLSDPNINSCPAMDPFEVYNDDLVRVTATLVDHHQVFPAFAYRFNTADGSVVFSGDTGPDTSGNLQKLADGSDVLVHEVIDRAWIDQKFGTPVPGSQMDALKTHMLESHTANDAVGQVATDCHVKTLVLNHIVPGNTPAQHLQVAEQNFSGTLIIGKDLMQIGIGKAS